MSRFWIKATEDEDGVSADTWGERLPDSPALPAVARWLAQSGLTYQQVFSLFNDASDALAMDAEFAESEAHMDGLIVALGDGDGDG